MVQYGVLERHLQADRQKACRMGLDEVNDTNVSEKVDGNIAYFAGYIQGLLVPLAI